MVGQGEKGRRKEDIMMNSFKGFFELQAISKMQITFKDKARADEKAQHTTGVCEHFEEARNTVIGR